MQDTTTRRTDAAAAGTAGSDREYKVGPGRPPREYRFKLGQSGNPKGAKRKPRSMAPDLKAALERALNKKIKLKRGDEERTVTMAAADHVMLKDKDGKDVTVKVTKDTKVKSKPVLKVEEIKAGTRVVVTATEAKDKSFTAKTIEVGVATAAAK